jgi:hypothetical protein
MDRRLNRYNTVEESCTLSEAIYYLLLYINYELYIIVLYIIYDRTVAHNVINDVG